MSPTARRLLTIPGYAVAWAILVGGAPLWLLLAALADFFRSVPPVALRGVVFVGFFLSFELLGLAIAGALWVARRFELLDAERWVDVHFQLEAWWGTTLFRAIVLLCGLRIEVEGDAEAELDRGPYLLMLRHASAADTLLASALVTRPHGIRLRYVLKKELLLDPCLDVVGNRVPNVFLDRGADDRAGEVRRLAALADGLGPRDAVLIYPEGTRFSEAKRMRVLTRLERDGNAAAVEYARGLRCVLPPRPAGSLAMLERAPEADVVVCAHAGFEGSGSAARVLSGALIHQRIRVRFRRIAHHEIPTERAAAEAWLRDVWRDVDAWVCAQQPDVAAASASEASRVPARR